MFFSCLLQPCLKSGTAKRCAPAHFYSGPTELRRAIRGITRLNQICPFNVREAQHGEAVQNDQVLIAPVNKHMTIEADGMRGLKVALSDQHTIAKQIERLLAAKDGASAA